MGDLVYLGVDGGGSKTRAVVVAANGSLLGEGLAGSSNHHFCGIDAAAAALRAAVDEAMSPDMTIAGAAIGLSGVDVASDRRLWEPHLADLASSVTIMNDAELLLTALPEGWGIACVAGTGAIAVGRSAPGTTARASGWGHLIGDEGGGYDLGRRALRAAVRAADGRGAPTQLLAAVLHHWHLTDPEELIAALYYDIPPRIKPADSAPLVFAAADDGDAVALDLLDQAAAELADAICAVATRLGMAQSLPLALGGSLLLRQERLRESVIKRLAATFAEVSVVLVTDPAFSAALCMQRSSR